MRCIVVFLFVLFIARSETAFAAAPAPCDITLSPGSDIVQAANNNPGKVICLPDGAYLTTSIRVTVSNVTLRAINRHKARIQGRIEIQGWYNTLDGLWWDAALDPQNLVSNPGLIAIAGQNNIVQNCLIANLQGSAADGSPGGVGVRIGKLTNGFGGFTDAHNNSVLSNRFDGWGPRAAIGDCGDGICASQPIAVGCSVADQGEQGCNPAPQFSGTRIIDNVFTNGPYGIKGYNPAIQTYMPTEIGYNLIELGNIGLEVKTHNVFVHHNELRRMSSNALGNRSGFNSFYENNYVHDIRDNTAPTAQADQSKAVFVFSGYGLVFRNNIVVNNHRGFVANQIDGPANPIGAVQLINNTFAGNEFGLQFIGLPTGGGAADTRFQLVNNIFVGMGAATQAEAVFSWDYPDNLYVPGNANSVITTMSNNLFWNSYPSTARGYQTDAPIIGDPRFIGGGYGYTADRFQIGPDSAAIDQGRAFQNVPTTDFFSTARPSGIAHDIGADER